MLQAIIRGYRRSLEWSMSSLAALARVRDGCRRLLCSVRIADASAARSARSFCRTWMKARSGRAAHLAPSTGPTEGERVMKQARLTSPVSRR